MINDDTLNLESVAEVLDGLDGLDDDGTEQSQKRQRRDEKLLADMGSTKMDRLCYIIRKIANDEKAVVFCEYRLMIDIIGWYFNYLEIPYVTYDGRLTQEEKTRTISTFKRQPSIKVFVWLVTWAI